MGETQTGQVQTPEPKALTIPVNVTIEAAEVVLAQPEMEELLQGAELIAVGDCYCREAAGNCDRPLEVCLALNDEAQDNIDRNRWRAIGVAEALDILERTHRAGLVHHAFRRSNGSVNLICSCCSCCCEFLGSLTHLTYHDALTESAYVAAYNSDACIQCGVCIRRCPFGAFSRESEQELVAFNADRCFGCGLCASTCPSRAITFVARS